LTIAEQNINDLFSKVGIDSIGFATPSFYLSLENLAKVRDVNPDKYKFGLMVQEMRIPDIGEDVISLGLKAAYNALIRGNVNPKEIDAVFVGTEATVYSVKSISNIFKDLLGISTNCLTQDIANACAASTLAIMNAVALIESGVIHKALVIAVDISSYDLGSPGEPTQGAGAVAIVITRNPRIAVFGKNYGKISSNITDFFRPEGERNAQVFGQYSISSYLNLQMEAFNDLRSQIGKYYADYYIFHAPYPKLPLKFMQKLIAERGVRKINVMMDHDNGKSNPSTETSYFDSLNQDFLLTEEILVAVKENFPINRHDEIKKWICQKLRKCLLSPLQIPALFGNMYSASLWAQFMYLVENDTQANETIYFGSYGSGATAISGLLKIQPNFREVLSDSLRITNFFTNKVQKSVEEYEKLRSNENGLNLAWIKIRNGHQYNFHLAFCNEGCILSSQPGLNYCPKGHSGHNQVEYPVVGTIIKILPFTSGELDPLQQGYALMVGTPKIGDLVEFELRRWHNEHETHPKHGLLNWIPIYQAVQYSPYVDFIEQTGEIKIQEPGLIKSKDTAF